MNRIILPLLAFALALGLLPCSSSPCLPGASCAHADEAANPQQIAAGKPRTARIAQGSSLTLRVGSTIEAQPYGFNPPCTWKSLNPGTVSASEEGILHVKRPGLAFITATDAATGRVVAFSVKAYRKTTQQKARKTLRYLKKAYKPGISWTNSKYYFWQAKHCHCYGCSAFAGALSDAVFGKYAPFSKHSSYARIKPGDHVRIADKHSVVVLKRRRASLVVAEGNYRSKVRWGRTIKRSELVSKGFYVETRY